MESSRNSNRVEEDDIDMNDDMDDDGLEDIPIGEDGEETIQTGAQSGASKKRKGGSVRSDHWKGFTLLWVEEGDPPDKTRKGKCKTCGAIINADSRNGTNGLKNHTISCSRKHKNATGGQTVLHFTPAGTDGTSALSAWKFDQKFVRLTLVEMIILDELPFIHVEKEGFKKFVAAACPMFHIPSRQTIRDDCVKLFLERKDRLKTFFTKKGMGRVSLTTDSWTSVNNTNFMCVTAHFINKDWILHKRIITFVKIVSHKGVDIGEAIVTAMKEWGLQRLLCCTLDNATANDGAVKHVKHYLDGIRSTVLDGGYLHMRCAAHILNLVVKDGLLEIGISVHRVREAVKWIKASPARASKFYEYAKLVKIESKKQLCLDVPTRWNSTYLMLESAEPYEQVFEVCGSMFSSYTEDLRNKKYDNGQHIIGAPEAVDWVNIRKIIEYLKKFYDLTLLASGTSYATSHLFFVEMCDIFDLIAELELNEDQEVSLMATNMRKKIGKYWLEGVESNPNMNRLLYIAAVLDPRQKLKLVEKCFKSVYGLERAAVLVSEVTSALKELFEFYKVSHHVAPTSRPRVSASTSTSIRERRSERRSAMSLEALQESDQDCDDLDTNELTIYLTEKQYKVGKNDVDQFDILMWWSSNTARYPVLAEMARDILAVPISSVASECAFSMGGRVLSPYRSSLAPEMVEALICAEDWLRSTDIDKKDEEGVPEEEQQKEFEMVLHSYTHGDPRTAQSQTDQSGSRATETD